MKQSKLFIKKLNKILINNYNKYFIENEILLNNAKYIDGFENYVIFKNGKVFTFSSKHSDKYMKLNKDKDGYLYLKLTKNKHSYHKLLNRLLGIAFIENPKPDEYNIIDHIDGNNQNNNLDNLRWCNNSINNRNQKLLKRNTSGHQGVRFETTSNQWKVRWYDENKKVKTKSFSLNKFDNAKKLAIEYRKEMVDKYYNRLNNM